VNLKQVEHNVEDRYCHDTCKVHFAEWLDQQNISDNPKDIKLKGGEDGK
jgi:hypothetical protein